MRFRLIRAEWRAIESFSNPYDAPLPNKYKWYARRLWKEITK